MKLLATANDTGALKLIVCPKYTDTSKKESPQPKAVRNICKGDRQSRILQFVLWEDDSNKYLVATRADGSICVYDFTNDEEIEENTIEAQAEGATAAATASAAAPEDEDKYEQLAKITGFGKFVGLTVQKGLCWACTETGEVVSLDPLNLDKDVKKYQLPKGEVSYFVSDPVRDGYFSFGGKENDVKVVKLVGTEFETVFKAKNVPDNQLQLREPIWPTAACFTTEEGDAKSDANKLVVVTHYGQVRRYDSTHGRKPVRNSKVSQKAFLTLQKVPDAPEIISSDTGVTTAKYNYESGQLVCKYPGSAGCIEALRLQNGLLITGGLDRYVRVFEQDSRKCIAKVYVGTQIGDVMILEGPRVYPKKESNEEKTVEEPADGDAAAAGAAAAEEPEDSSDESADEMWSKLETSRKRRRLQLKKK